MIDLEKYRTENGYFNAAMFAKEHNEKTGLNRSHSIFLHIKGVKLFMADMVTTMNSLSDDRPYNKNNIKITKYGFDGYVLFLPELFARFVIWYYKSFESDALHFVNTYGYKFGIEDQELVSFVVKNYFRYMGGKVDLLATHREVALCKHHPVNRSFTREDVVRMNISMITSGVPFEARKEIIYTNFY